ncbi:WapI family immunity protein [Aneurinibacillus aneurinilyticus]|jgi:hypothetical protein|uniref:WapI family immunity protein n=1 Tax=Aneurinibacillus aneurinilyticus TaxID=1391 RepID=UPI0023EFE48B|nr:hypothetical protein [Aneurinibacillus aneurinilyticus]MCI1695605.1 hypothetical protein [Aneurinibacillus aneurinilyticus]
MADLINDEKNIRLTLNLKKNGFLDIEHSREDFENWIPFELVLSAENETYSYLEQRGATLSLYETKNLIKNLEKIVRLKSSYLDIEKYEFSSSETYFELIFDETYEENLVYIELWINMGSYSGGKSFGYDKGFRFVVMLSDLKDFCDELKTQLNSVL